MLINPWRLAVLLCMIIIGKGRVYASTTQSLSTGIILTCCTRDLDPSHLALYRDGPEPCLNSRNQMQRIHHGANFLEDQWRMGCPIRQPGSKLEGMERRVRAAPSSIHGTGLFACSDLEVGTVATFFPVHSLRVGNMIVQDMVMHDNTYNIIPSSHAVDCFQHSLQGSCLQHLTIAADPHKHTPGWLGHLANDVTVCASDSDADIALYAAECREKSNSILVPFGDAAAPLMCLVVMRRVAAGEELLRSYGPDHWTTLAQTLGHANSPDPVLAQISCAREYQVRRFPIFDQAYGYTRLLNALVQQLEIDYVDDIAGYAAFLHSGTFSPKDPLFHGVSSANIALYFENEKLEKEEKARQDEAARQFVMEKEAEEMKQADLVRQHAEADAMMQLLIHDDDCSVGRGGGARAQMPLSSRAARNEKKKGGKKSAKR
mmetsp:Transcript_10475/g.15048  ORF Transcript_10475/g.15048 Transcript_10475/m.15048 type:complete len:431 (-) Transcript_10475:18-1310(-)